jgi:hypothetical protein
MTSTVERAFELARARTYNNLDEIKKQLRVEHLDEVDAHLSGSLAKQLAQVIKASQASE